MSWRNTHLERQDKLYLMKAKTEQETRGVTAAGVGGGIDARKGLYTFWSQHHYANQILAGICNYGSTV